MPLWAGSEIKSLVPLAVCHPCLVLMVEAVSAQLGAS